MALLINEDCEGAGTPSGWGGAGDWDSTSSPLAGAQSLRLVAQTASNESTFTESECYLKFLFKVASLPGSNTSLVVMSDSGFNDMIKITMVTDGTFFVDCGGIFEQTVSAMSSGTMYYVWVDYIKGSGANAVAKFYFNTTDSKPSFGDGKTAGATNGTQTADVTKLFLAYNGTADFDNIKLGETTADVDGAPAPPPIITSLRGDLTINLAGLPEQRFYV